MASRKKNKTTKLFVLDTNVLLHDPTCLYRFEEHDVFIPIITLEELDTHKKGMSEVARNARQASRFLDDIVSAGEADIEAGIPLKSASRDAATGKLILQTQAIHSVLPDSMPVGKADNQILGIVMALKDLHKDRSVILVSKDINMRIKARALGLEAEDYFNDKVLEDTDLLYTGTREIDEAFWERNGKEMTSWQEHGRSYYQVKGPDTANLYINQMLWQEGNQPLQARVISVEGKVAVLETLKDYSHSKNNVWGITARNREQNFALNMLMNPDIDFVTLLGQAGTGKTLLT
ncbi:MAG TPA: PIN domain-containing protein, partial [Chromobacteriaceae bacterium]|nr:PIN domain-containing protein [Chromobacteriaceae bacterium]